MKTLVFHIKNPTEGDFVYIEALSPAGGQNNAKHTVHGEREQVVADDKGEVTETKVIPADGPREVAQGLANCINNECQPDCAHADVKDDTGELVVKCTDVFSNITWRCGVTGSGKTTITKTEY